MVTCVAVIQYSLTFINLRLSAYLLRNKLVAIDTRFESHRPIVWLKIKNKVDHHKPVQLKPEVGVVHNKFLLSGEWDGGKPI